MLARAEKKVLASIVLARANTVFNQKAKINGKKITEYYVDVDLTFMIDRDRE